MKTLLFIIIYGGVMSCVSFTLVTLLSAPSYTSAVLAVPAVLLANRVGVGFGIELFPPRNTTGKRTDS